jgi:hypothetical protein
MNGWFKGRDEQNMAWNYKSQIKILSFIPQKERREGRRMEQMIQGHFRHLRLPRPPIEHDEMKKISEGT